MSSPQEKDINTMSVDTIYHHPLFEHLVPSTLDTGSRAITVATREGMHRCCHWQGTFNIIQQQTYKNKVIVT